MVPPTGRRAVLAVRSSPLLSAASMLALFAMTNLLLAYELAMVEPARIDDLRTIYVWCRQWLFAGTQLYAPLDGTTDYPPYAIVFFSGLAAAPLEWLTPVWVGLVVALTPILAWVVVRSTSLRTKLSEAALPITLFCGWGCVRMGLQFTRVSMALAFLAVTWADTRPIAAGVCLGLGLAKPHIAGPIALWALATNRFRIVGVGAAVVAAGVVLYCLRVQETPLVVLTDYLRTMRSMYAGGDPFLGRTGIRPWLRGLTSDQGWADTLWVAASAALLLIPIRIARALPRANAEQTAAALAMFCLWSLLAGFHLAHNLVLLLPAFVFLLLVDDPPTAWPRFLFLAVVQGLLMVDPPLHVAPLLSEHSMGRLVAADTYRFITLSTFVFVGLLWSKTHGSTAFHPGTRPCDGRRARPQ